MGSGLSEINSHDSIVTITWYWMSALVALTMKERLQAMALKVLGSYTETLDACQEVFRRSDLKSNFSANFESAETINAVSSFR